MEHSLISHHSQKLAGNVPYQNGGLTESTDNTVFNPSLSDVTTPLALSDAPYDTSYQQWGKDGRALGHAADPRVVAPQPRRATTSVEATFVVPPRTGSAAVTGQPSLERTDTAEWGLQTNAADGQVYPLHALPAEPLQNPFETVSSETVQPTGLPPAPSSAGQYAFSTPQHSFEGGKTPTRPPYSSPPSYS